jgi:hypothetical protein
LKGICRSFGDLPTGLKAASDAGGKVWISRADTDATGGSPLMEKVVVLEFGKLVLRTIRGAER